MNLIETLKKAWDNRESIAEGLYNTYLNHIPEIDEEAQRRKAICETNECGYYDKDGKPETSSLPGTPTCSKCTCNIDMKTHCMSCYCTLADTETGLQMDKALWKPLMDNDMEKVIAQKNWENQFKPKI